MKKQPKYSPEVIERAVRMVGEAGGQYELQWAAVTSIAAKISTWKVACRHYDGTSACLLPATRRLPPQPSHL